MLAKLKSLWVLGYPDATQLIAPSSVLLLEFNQMIRILNDI